MTLQLDDLKKWYRDHYDEILQDYLTFLRFPSISTDPAHKDAIRQTADWLCAYLKRIGMKVELWETSGYPVVFGSLEVGKDRPTVLLYNHYDVQPVDPLALWKHDPFEPTIRDNIVYARGASDNKGQCFYTVTALRAFLELSKKKDLNIKLFIEGEEESGGRGTTEIVKKKRDALKADALYVIDAGMTKPNAPAVTIGVRGLVTMEFTCQNSSIDLHSGIHGGIALNPNRALATLLASLWDEKGRVTVPHFYDDLRPVTKEELSLVDQSFDRDDYSKKFGVGAFSPEGNYSLVESNWIRPTLEINGMWGGYTGSGFKTVIPAQAHAKLSCRLVPNQDPQRIGQLIEAHLRSKLPQGMKLTMKIDQGAPAYRISPCSHAVHVAATAFSEVFRKPCQYILCGASIPIVVDLADASTAEAVQIGVALDTDDFHAPNEHFGLDRFEQGFLSIGRILDGLASTKDYASKDVKTS